MSINPLNDISKVYLEQVVDEAYQPIGKDKENRMYRRAGNLARTSISADNPEVKISTAKKSARIVSAITRQKERERFDTIGQSPSHNEEAKPDYLDFDNDGNEKESMKKALKDKAKKQVKEALVGNQHKIDANNNNKIDADDFKILRKKKTVKEGYSNWREDLAEVINDDKSDVKITEKKINNKVKTSAMSGGIKLGESVEEMGGTLLEMVELDEEYITETVDIATEYFYEQGLNEEGLDILIEELGLEEFVDFVFELSQEYTLTEAKFDRLPPVSKSGKNISSLKGGAKASAIKSKRQIRTVLRQKVDTESQSKPGFKSFSQKHAAVAKAKKQQPANKPLKDRIAKGVLGAVKAYQQGMVRHRAATATAGKALRVAGKGVSEFGKGVASGVKTAGKVARDVRRVVGEESQLDEKAESEQQQKLFGLALSVKRGDTPRSEVSDAVLKIVDTMSEKKIRDFAKTKHEGIPKKVEEAVADTAPLSPQELQAQKQKSQLETRIAMLRKQSLSKMKKPGTVQSESTTDKALELVRQSIIQKHGAASLVGTPEHNAAAAAAAEKAKNQPKPKPKKPFPDDVYSRDSLGGIRGYRSGD